MEERVAISLLIDFYGALLTERQRQCLELHHEDDMSYGEIAEELGVSRPAVHDTMQRALQLLHEYEAKLHAVAHYEAREKVMKAMATELDAPRISRERLRGLLAQMEG